jgi:hypothetical protein
VLHLQNKAKEPVNETNETAVNKQEPAQEETVTSIAPKKSDLPATTIQSEQKKDIAGNLAKPEIKKQELPVIKQEAISIVVAEETKTVTKKSDLVTTAKAPEEKKLISEAAQLSLLK